MNLGQPQITARTNQTGHGTPIATIERPNDPPQNGQPPAKPPIPIRGHRPTAFAATVAPVNDSQRAPGQPPPPPSRTKQVTSSDVLTSAPSVSALQTPVPPQVQQPEAGRKNTVLGIAPPPPSRAANATPQQPPSDTGERMEPRGRLPSDALGLQIAGEHKLAFPQPDLSPIPAPRVPQEAVVDPADAQTTIYEGGSNDGSENMTTHYERRPQPPAAPLAQRVVPISPLRAVPPANPATQRGLLSAPPPNQAIVPLAVAPRSISPAPFQQAPSNSSVAPRSSNPPPRLNPGATVPPQGIKSITAIWHEHPNLRTIFELLDRTVPESEELDTLSELQSSLLTATTPETREHCYAAIAYIRGRMKGRGSVGTASAPAQAVTTTTPQPAKPNRPTDFGLITAIILNILLPFIIIAPLKGMMDMDWGGAISIGIAATIISFLPILFRNRKKPYGSKSAVNLTIIMITVMVMAIATHLHKAKASDKPSDKPVAAKTAKATAKSKPAPAPAEESDSSDSER